MRTHVSKILLVVISTLIANAWLAAEDNHNSLVCSKKLMIAFGYSPAFTRRGHGLEKVTEPALIGDPFRGYYWLHNYGFEMGFFLTRHWSVEIGRKWFYGRMGNSRKVATMILPNGEGGWLYRNIYWDVLSDVYLVAVSYYSQGSIFARFGIEFYNSIGEVHNIAWRWDDELHQDVERFIDTSNSGRGYGFVTQTGWRWKITPSVMWGLSFGVRIGKSLEKNHSVPEDIAWGGPVDFDFCGLFVAFNICFMPF